VIAAADLFGEALAVPAIVHTQASTQRALAIGPAASSLLTAASRYPFAELVYLGDDAPKSLRSPSRPDRRLRILPGIMDLPRDWYADVVAVATPGTPDASLNLARRLSSNTTVGVVALDKPQAGGELRKRLQSLWRWVVPYREHLPEPQVFFLVSDAPLSVKRPIPSWTRRLTEGYLSSLFRFGKDESAALSLNTPVVPTVSNLKGPS